MKIVKVTGREVLDSRGNPTVEAEVVLEDGSIGRGISPSGASTGEFEALELRDNDRSRYLGKGVQKAVDNINEKIAQSIIGMNADNIYEIDSVMKKIDGINLYYFAVHSGPPNNTVKEYMLGADGVLYNYQSAINGILQIEE